MNTEQHVFTHDEIVTSVIEGLTKDWSNDDLAMGKKITFHDSIDNDMISKVIKTFRRQGYHVYHFASESGAKKDWAEFAAIEKNRLDLLGKPKRKQRRAES